MRKLNRVFTFINRFLCYVSVMLTLFLMALIVADIFGRFFLHKSIIGTPAFARNAVVGITFLALPWLTWERKHLHSEMIVDRTKGLLKKFLEWVSSSVAVVVLLLYSFSLIKPTLHAFQINEMDVEGTTFIPITPFYIICLLGCFLAALSALRMFVPGAGSAPEPLEKEPTGFEI